MSNEQATVGTMIERLNQIKEEYGEDTPFFAMSMDNVITSRVEVFITESFGEYDGNRALLMEKDFGLNLDLETKKEETESVGE